jgi:hypothetical protein
MVRPKQNFKIALDLANSCIKVAAEDYEDRLESYIDIHCRPSDSLGNVVIKDSAANNTEVFCVGYGAAKSPTGRATITDKSTKIKDIHKLYLGALAHLPQLPSVMKNYIVVSSHAWQSHKDEIKAKLELCRQVCLAGKDVDLTTEVLLVVPEGFGAIVDYNDEKIVTLDFGAGTTLLTPYIRKRPQESIVSHVGVNELYLMIQSAMKAKNYGYTGNVRKIREQIELGSLQVEGCNIKEVYQQCLVQWWNENLKEYSYEAVRLTKSGYRVICIGGGVALPGFSKVLTSKSLEVVSKRPEMASVRGMFKLAMQQAAKKGV